MKRRDTWSNLPSRPSVWSHAVIQSVAALSLLWLAGCEPGMPEAGVTDGEAVSADGARISYEVRGTGDPALVLVHGWANTREIWGIHPETLSRTQRVVALDLAGHGQSGAERRDWTMDAFGEDVVAVVDQLGLDGVVLVGFSMGAIAVVEAAERLGDRVLGLVFIDMFQDPNVWMSDDEATQFTASMRAGWSDTAFIRAFAFTPDAPDSLVAYVMAMMPQPPPEHLFTVFESASEWMKSEFRPTLRDIDRPMAAINTSLVPTNLEAWRSYAPSFTVDVIEGVGHAGILLRHVDEFDSRLRAIVDRFASTSAEDRVERR